MDEEWGVDMAGDTPGGLVKAAPEKPARQITLLQRKPTPLGKDLGKTSGWVHRATLKSRNVEMLKNCSSKKLMMRACISRLVKKAGYLTWIT